MDRERNLLFGVFAVQLNQVTPAQLAEEAAFWLKDPSLDIPQRLVNSGAMTDRDCDLIQEMVERAVTAHGGDSGVTLSRFGGNEQVSQSFQGTVVIADSMAATKVASTDSLDFHTDPEVFRGVEESAGRYTRESEHARGGMGRILVTHDEHLDRDVALKELLPELSRADGKGFGASTPATPMMARFLQEARLTGRLEHPSIVPVYELGHRANGTLYYTMKLVRGQSLAAAIEETNGLQERLGLLSHFVDLCQAMAYAHSRGVIHRDLKPENVMVGEFGETVVIDWGLAKARGRRDVHDLGRVNTNRPVAENLEGGDSSKTAYGYALGTPAYMPPEQAKGELDKIDERSDVYSLGTCLYELLTAQMPFEGVQMEDALRLVIEEGPAPIKSIEPNAPPELIAICERAMRRERRERYRSAKELADEIKRFQSGALVESYDYKVSEVVRKWVKKRRSLVVTATFGIVFAIGLSVVYVLNLAEEKSRTVEANRLLTSSNTQLESSSNLMRISRDLADEQRLAMERQAYLSAILLAEIHVENGNSSAARHTLLNAPKRWRNWEWGFLYGSLDPSVAVLTSHLESVSHAAYSADGRRMVTASADHTVKVWDAGTNTELLTLRGHVGPVNSAAFSSNGRRIVTASDDGTVKVWNASSGKELFSIAGTGDEMRCAAFSRQGGRIVTASQDGTARMWNGNLGKELVVFSGHRGGVNWAAFGPNGRRIVTASDDRTAKVWDAASGAVQLTLAGHEEKVYSASFSPNGNRIVTASADGTARVWHGETGEELLSFGGHSDRVYSASFSGDGRRIVTASNDKTAKVWDAATGKELLALAGHDDMVYRAVFSPDARWVLTASFDKTAKVWDARSDPNQLVLKGHGGVVNTVAFSPDGSLIVTSSYDGTAKVWDGKTLKELRTLRGHVNMIYSASFSADGARIVTAGADKTARVWDAVTGAQQLVLKGHGDGLYDAAFSSDGTRVVTASWSGPPRLWDAVTGEERATLSGHGDRVVAVAFSPDGGRVVTASSDGTAKIWDAASGRLIRTLFGHEGQVNSVAFDAEGAQIVTASNDRTAKVWDVETGVDRLTLSGHAGVVTKAAFNPEGTRVVTASGDSTARIWDGLTGTELTNLTGHGGGLFLAMFSPDGDRVLTASSDKTIKVWDGEEGVNVRTIEGSGSGLYSAVFSPDGLRIVSAYGDGAVKVWEALPWNEEDWHDAAKREQLLAMTGKAAPDVSKYEFLVEREEVYGHIRAMLSRLEEAEDQDKSPSMKTAEGLGLMVLEPSAFNIFPELELRRGDILFRMNERDTPTRADASAALQAALDALEGDPTRPLWLRFEVLNYLSRRMAVLHFPGIIRAEITLSPALALGVLDATIVASENDVERALRQTLADTGLQEDARIIAFAGNEITDFDSWAPVLARTKKSLEAGECESFDILSVRDRTDQLILITVAVSEGPEAASPNP